MMEKFINPDKCRDRPKLECHSLISSVVDFCLFVVGWAVPTFGSKIQRYFVGAATLGQEICQT
jgi:hypothetical protein